jgi:putative ABC transport system permease protein
MLAMIQDLRYAFRLLAKTPAFTLVAVVTLALGIGANTAIFSVVNAVLLKPLPYRQPEGLVQFWETNPIKGWTQNVLAPANFFDWQEQSNSFEGMAAYIGSDTKAAGLSDLQLTGNGEPEHVKGLFVTGNLFDVLGAQPALGRTLREEETWEGHSRVVVLSNGLWRRRFAADPAIVGKTISMNGRDVEVVGVMPVGFYFPSSDVELYCPTGWNKSQMAQVRRAHFLRAVARLKPGVTLDEARAEMSAIASRLEQQYPATNTQMGVGLGPLKEWIVSDARPALLIFLAAVGLVLLIACANVANLMLVRAASRTREIAIREALGASRIRVIRQLLIESMLLALVGGVVGLLLALWGSDALRSLDPGNIPRLDEVNLDLRVLAFTLALTALTTLIFGLAPALENSKPDLTTSLKEGGQKGIVGSHRGRVRNAFVVSEVALSLVLVIAAGLMVKSFWRLQRVDPGFTPENLLTVNISLPGARYPQGADGIRFYSQLCDRLKSLPGVNSVGATSRLALRGAEWTSDFSIEGRPPDEYGKEVRHKSITPEYFDAMKIPLIAGRRFEQNDTQDSSPVIIINEALARRHFGDEDAIGRRLSFSRPWEKPLWRTIVGVVKDEKQDGLRVEPLPEIYQPFAENPRSNMTVVIRTGDQPTKIISAVRHEIAALDKDLAPFDMQTGEQVVSGSMERDRFAMVLLAVFAGVAIILAAVGIYGVMSYSVSQRTHEIGVRMALGAQTRDITALIVGDGLKLTLVGLMTGIMSAFGLTRLMTSLLYGVSATDPLTFIEISLWLGAVSLLASYMPARRATKVDPLVSLRYE